MQYLNKNWLVADMELKYQKTIQQTHFSDDFHGKSLKNIFVAQILTEFELF